VLLLGAVAVAAGMWFGPEIRTSVALQRWSAAGPRNVVRQFVAALDRGDTEALSALCYQPPTIETQEGRISAVRVGGLAGQPPRPVAEVTPSASTDAAKVGYDTRGKRGGYANITAPNQAGGEVTFQLQRIDGAWKLTSVLPRHAAVANTGG
jgi:hypothetical protein